MKVQPKSAARSVPPADEKTARALIGLFDRQARTPKELPRIAYTLPEVARTLGVSVKLLRLEVKRGNLPAFRLGGGGEAGLLNSRLLIRARDLEAYISARMVAP